MQTVTAQQKFTLAFINDKSPILDLICNDLIASGIEVNIPTKVHHGFRTKVHQI